MTLRSQSTYGIIRGELADYMPEESGILVAYGNSRERTLQNVADNIRLIRKISGNKPVLMLMHVQNSPMPDSDTRKYIVEQMPISYKALALMVNPGFGSLIMNMLFKARKPPVPIKTFTDEKKAREWLLSHA